MGDRLAGHRWGRHTRRVSDSRSAATGGAISPTLTVAAVARRLGVAPATLRTWARRYGLGPSAHTAGAHRRYSAQDLARLVIMRRLTHEGVAPAEAARLALAQQEPIEHADALAPVIALVPGGPTPDAVPASLTQPSGGGRIVPLPQASPAVRGLARACMALDSGAVTEVLRRQVAAEGVVRTWDALITPVLVGLGERWAATGEGVEVEHLLAECVIAVLGSTTARLREPRNTGPILLACVDEEQHTLPLHALAAALAERDVGCRLLGARTPPEALASAVRRSGPGVVFLSASMPVPAVTDLAQLVRVRPAPRILVGGSGWPSELPPTARRVSSLQQCVDLIVSIVV